MNQTASVSYDGFNFSDNGLVLTLVDHMTLPSRRNQIESRANRDGGILVQSQLGAKPITLEGFYIGDSITDAQLMYDTIARALNRQQRPLIVAHAGGTRQYIATPENVVIKEPDGLNRLEFSMEFVVPEGSSESISDTVLVDEIVTTSTATIPITVEGSVAARPVITLTFNSVTDGTGKRVTLRNARDYVGLTFDRDFVTGDVITIDSENFQIYINGVLTAPEGRMPSWSAGSGSLYYSDTFTSRSVDIYGEYNERNY